jgi:iron complex outermembrane receptor protein
VTAQQLKLYGKNFAINNDPTSEFCKCYNDEKKNTDFEYIDFKYDFGLGITAQDQAYTYFYTNKTIAADDLSGIIGGPNTSHPKDKSYNQADIGGYNKGNRYRVYGDIVRVNKDWTFGTLKAGALLEYSSTDRHNLLYDLTTGLPDFNPKYGPPAPTNAKTIETSSWLQYQLFADFEIHPIANLTLTPGFKYVNFERKVDGTVENSVIGAQTRAAIIGTNTYDSPLYFFTGNYKITPYWSVYGQYATGFLVPSLTYLYADNLSLNNLKPQKSVNYQGGTVYSRGRFTADADVYKIDVSNFEIANPICQCYLNGGNASYSGVEGELAYAFPFGLTLFTNGSINTAKDKTHNKTLPDAPKWTDAVGALYDYHRWQASLTWKEVGRQISDDGPELGAYNTVDTSIAYDFGLIKVKLAAFNLADHRSTVLLGGGFFAFQSGREILGTIEARLH